VPQTRLLTRLNIQTSRRSSFWCFVN
jgi:hypothetical protein